jgi:thiol-disulfide isomerase/thioredoxin
MAGIAARGYGLVPGVNAGVWVLIGAIALAVGVGVLLRWRNGRFRSARTVRIRGVDDKQPPVIDPGSRLGPGDLGVESLGERATLVHFSSAFCAPCRATRQTLTQVSEAVEGVGHVEIDAESHLDLVRRVDVRRTPTVLVLDPDGRILTRASGPLRKADVLAVLDAVAS